MHFNFLGFQTEEEEEEEEDKDSELNGSKQPPNLICF
jgi:hypothetical protein